MDELSSGVCLQEPIQVKLEFRRFVHRSTFGIGANDLREWFWTKVGYIGGVQLPIHSSYDAETVNLIQKLSIDTSWRTSLVHMAERVGSDNEYSMPEILYADATNEDARWYRENRVSFKEAWAREKAHIFRSNWDDFRGISAEIYQRHKADCDAYTTNPKETQFDPFNFPSIQVLAGVNAACFTSLKRFTQNDMFDFRHAALAVPYYDALFCDTPLAQLLSKKPLQFASTYSVAILSKPNEMLEYLRGL